MSKSICIFIKSLRAGGAEKQAILLANILSNPHRVILVSFEDFMDDKYLPLVNDKEFELLFLKGIFIKKIYAFAKILKQNNIDIIFSYLLLANFIGGLVGKVLNVRYRIGGIRNCYLKPKKEILERILHNYFSSYTIFNNYTGYKKFIEKGFKKEKCLFIPNCIEDYSTNSFRRRDSQTVKILSIGRFVEQKDYITSLKVIKKIINNGYQNISYTIVGYGCLENFIRNSIKNMGIENKVSLIINPASLKSIYLESDIYLSTSIFEGLSNSIMEAMNYGLPIVATDVADNSFLVKNGVNGFLGSIKDVDSIADSVLKLILSAEERVNFGAASRLILKENYSEKIFTDRYFNFIASLDRLK